MSKSHTRVMDALSHAGLSCIALEMAAPTRTAQQAADAAGCDCDQIAKSIIFAGAQSNALFLFITAGGNHVDPDKASALADEVLLRADANAVRKITGFAIGGVSPVGHLHPIKAFFDQRLLDFGLVYAAAGTPRHIFGIDPHDLQRVSMAQPADFIS